MNPLPPAQHMPPDTSTARRKRFEWLFWGMLFVVSYCSLTGYLLGMKPPEDSVAAFSLAVWGLVKIMWWGIALGIVSITLLNLIPRELVVSMLGKGGHATGILRAALAGFLLDVSNQGLLMIAGKLYERGASLGQTIAFLIASPWNSFSLLLLMFALIGWKWTLMFVLLSLVIALISGLVFDRLVARGVLPANPNSVQIPDDFRFWKEARKALAQAQWSIATSFACIKKAVRESRLILRWILFGIVLGALVQTFLHADDIRYFFGPTLMGLAFTMIGATLIEICAEGAPPIASDLLMRANAPGNAFAFQMAAVSTDYTEIFVLHEITRSWKVALFLPLVTVPQVVLLAWLLNNYSL